LAEEWTNLRGSLLVAGDEEGEKKDKAGTAMGDEVEQVCEEPATGKNHEGIVESCSLPTDLALEHLSTGGTYGVITSVAALPFWSPNSNSSIRIPDTDPAMTPKAEPIPFPDDSIYAPEIGFCCEICQDIEPEADTVTIDECGHRFWGDCIQGFISSWLADGKFPIICPTCAVGETRPAWVVSSWLAESVGMTDEYQRWSQLELAADSFAFECTRWVIWFSSFQILIFLNS
jgi:hypothetical protein